MQFWYLENMDPKLSKTVPIIPLRPLVMILDEFEIHQKHPKKGVVGGAKKIVTFSL